MNANQIVRVFVEGDLYVAGRTEDGEDYLAENYMVVFETKEGEIYRHKEMWLGCKVEEYNEFDEDANECYSGIAFNDIRAESEAAANKLCARVQAHVEKGGTLNMDHWVYRRTAYGSQAYLDECSMMTKEQLAGEA